MFGAGDHTNGKMHVHCYKRKNGHQFVDFLKRAEKRHGDAIKNIFVVIDNLSIPISKKVIEEMANMPKNKICILAS